MNVALATYPGTSSLGIMTSRGGRSVESGPEVDSASVSDRSRSSVFHYPVVGFSYDRETWRVIILFRDPDSGLTTSQIPSTAALERYKQNLRIEKADDAKNEASDRRGETSGGSASSSTGGVVVSLFGSKSNAQGVNSSQATSGAATAGSKTAGTGAVNVVV